MVASPKERDTRPMQSTKRVQSGRASLWYCRRKPANADWLQQPGWKNMTGHVKLATYLWDILCIACITGAHAQQQVVGAPPEASNMKLVGSQRSAGAQRLPADDPSSGRPLDRLYRPSRRHRRYSGAGQSADRQGRAERHLDRRCHRSRAAEISAPHSRAGRKIRGRRRADGAHLRRQGAAEG